MKIAILLLLIIWGIALMGLCSRRDLDPHTKISWVVVLLVFNGIGAIIYFIFAPIYKPANDTSHMNVPDDSEPIRPDHMKSWNPIIGYNQNEMGEGLNPSQERND